jgi:tetratricopeptide (TPR) repeat protein
MGRFLAGLTARIRRPWRPLFVLALLLIGGGLVGPHLLAWYHWRAGQSLLERFHGAEARAHLAACLKAWPSSPRVHLLAARAARLDGAFDEAERQLHQCQELQKSPSDETVLEWALWRAAGGDLDAELEEYLQKRLDKDPAQAPLICEARAEGYLSMCRILEAHACLDRWLALQPDNAQAHFLRGEVYRQAKTIQKGVADYRRAVELDPDRTQVRWWLGVSLQEVGRYEEALGQLDVVRKQWPDNPDVPVHMALCHNGLGRTDQARQLLDQVLARHPDDAQALKARGEVEMTAGRPEEAEPWLRRAAEALPYDYRAQWALAQCLQEEGKESEARAQQARAKQLGDLLERMSEIQNRKLPVRPHDPALQCELGRLLLDLGRPDLGERWLLSALHEDERYEPAHAALADFYDKQGDKDKAAYFRQRAEQLRAEGPPQKPEGDRAGKPPGGAKP